MAASVSLRGDQYRMRRPIGQAALLSCLRRLLPARLFEPSLRKAFALDPSGKGDVTESRLPPRRTSKMLDFVGLGHHGGLDGAQRQYPDLPDDSGSVDIIHLRGSDGDDPGEPAEPVRGERPEVRMGSRSARRPQRHGRSCRPTRVK